MAYLLQKGQSFITGDGDGTGTPAVPANNENTIQSFNGGIGGTHQNMYIEISAVGTVITHVGSSPAGLHGEDPFSFDITAAAANRSKVEVGDTVLLYNNADKDDTSHSFLITEVTHDTNGDIELTGYVTDYANGDVVQATDSGVVAGDITNNNQYLNIITDAFGAEEPANRIFSNHISAAEFIYNDGAAQEVDLLTQFPGLDGVEYRPGSDTLLLIFENTQQCTAAATTLRDHINNDDLDNTVLVRLTYDVTDTGLTWDRMDSEHIIHVGSKTNTTVETVTPITLPANLTIKAGSGVGDIFLTRVANV